MAFNANEFRQRLRLGGARPNLFEIALNFPGFAANGGDAGQDVRVFGKAASVPGSNLGTIEVPYFGRNIKFAGDRTYDTWELTVINDEDYRTRAAFESWHNNINQLDYTTGSQRQNPAGRPSDYVTDITVRQYAKTGVVTMQYQLKNAWPTTVAPIELSWETTDTIEEFGVTFAYDYFVTQSPDVSIGEGSFSEGSNVPSV